MMVRGTPPAPGDYVVWVCGPDVTGGGFEVGTWTGTRWVVFTKSGYDRVTHWWPLPAAPTEGEQTCR